MQYCTILGAKNMITLKNLKIEFLKKYPHSELTPFLNDTPDEIPEETFLELVKIWLKILNKK